ncbi:plasmid maintenance protein [Borrelia duttonii]
MKTIKAIKKLETQCKNKYQHKLIVLISTIDYTNHKYEKYTQGDLLYYFNGNLKRNGQKETTIKTLQKYIYKLGKEFKVTNNYYQHLGINMGTEVYYELKYNKKECHRLINKNFKIKKEKRFQKRVNEHFKSKFNKEGSVEKAESLYNKYNKNKKEEKCTSQIEDFQLRKYANKCNFKTNFFYDLLKLNLEKEVKVELLRKLKNAENAIKRCSIGDIKKKGDKRCVTLKEKQEKLSLVLENVITELKSKGYDSADLEAKMGFIYEKYRNKPHFIIEEEKYGDLSVIVANLKKTVKKTENLKSQYDDLKNNIFSILLDQLRQKVKIEILIPKLKEYLIKQKKLEYKKVFNNQYYYELLDLIENQKEHLKHSEFKEAVT